MTNEVAINGNNSNSSSSSGAQQGVSIKLEKTDPEVDAKIQSLHGQGEQNTSSTSSMARKHDDQTNKVTTNDVGTVDGGARDSVAGDTNPKTQTVQVKSEKNDDDDDEVDEKKNILPVKSSNEILAELFQVFNAVPPEELMDDKTLISRTRIKAERKDRKRKKTHSDEGIVGTEGDEQQHGSSRSRHKSKKNKKKKRKDHSSGERFRVKDPDRHHGDPYYKGNESRSYSSGQGSWSREDTAGDWNRDYYEDKYRSYRRMDDEPSTSQYVDGYHNTENSNSHRRQTTNNHHGHRNDFYGRVKCEAGVEEEYGNRQRSTDDHGINLSTEIISDISLSDEETYQNERVRDRSKNSFYAGMETIDQKDNRMSGRQEHSYNNNNKDDNDGRSNSRSKSHSRSPSRGENGVDKQRLLEVARKNAINMFKRGSLPGCDNMSEDIKDKVLMKMRYGGRTIEELTDFCRKLSNGENLSDLSSDEDSDIDKSGKVKAFHHPFLLKEREPIVMNIRNSKPLVPAKRTHEQTKAITMQYPVSSGQHHRLSESWVPVEPTNNQLQPLPALPSAKQSTTMFKNALGKSMPQQEQQQPAFKAVNKGAPSTTTTSTVEEQQESVSAAQDHYREAEVATTHQRPIVPLTSIPTKLPNENQLPNVCGVANHTVGMHMDDDARKPVENRVTHPYGEQHPAQVCTPPIVAPAVLPLNANNNYLNNQQHQQHQQDYNPNTVQSFQQHHFNQQPYSNNNNSNSNQECQQQEQQQQQQQYLYHNLLNQQQHPHHPHVNHQYPAQQQNQHYTQQQQQQPHQHQQLYPQPQNYHNLQQMQRYQPQQPTYRPQLELQQNSHHPQRYTSHLPPPHHNNHNNQHQHQSQRQLELNQNHQMFTNAHRQQHPGRHHSPSYPPYPHTKNSFDPPAVPPAGVAPFHSRNESNRMHQNQQNFNRMENNGNNQMMHNNNNNGINHMMHNNNNGNNHMRHNNNNGNNHMMHNVDNNGNNHMMHNVDNNGNNHMMHNANNNFSNNNDMASSSIFSTYPMDNDSADVSSIVSRRLHAMRRLQANPTDVEAQRELSNAQLEMSSWASSKVLPGQFTGSTGVNVLKPNELNSGPQVWARRDQMTSSKPLMGGMGMTILKKMGWKPGEGLGRDKNGVLQPLLLDLKLDKRGLKSIEDPNFCGKKQSAAKRYQQRFTNGSMEATYSVNGDNSISISQEKHPVCMLNELTAKRRWAAPLYTVVKESGEMHSRHFYMSVMVNGQTFVSNRPCNSKKEAKLFAAKVCLEQMGLLPKN